MSFDQRWRVLQRAPWSVLIQAMALLLTLIGVVAFFKGLFLGFWGPGGSHDLGERHLEVLTFLDGHYPNPSIDPRATREGLTHSVYLPYAFPMMVPLFAGGLMISGQVAVVLLSVASLAVMARWGYRKLCFAGRPVALAGAAAPLALNGIPPTMAAMQFSLICISLVLLQEELLERRRPWAAGLCWALAMLKPQIALPFALLFIWRQQWKGFVAGGGVLLGLSLVTTTWTGISPNLIAQNWMGGSRFDFTHGRMPLLPFKHILSYQLDPTILQWSLIGMAVLILLALALQLQARAKRIDMVNLTGFCSVLGALAFYHRDYDYVMLFPTLIALLRMSLLPQGRWMPWISLLAMLNAFLVWRPNNLSLPLPMATVQAVVWGVTGLLLAGRLLHRDPAAAPRQLASS